MDWVTITKRDGTDTQAGPAAAASSGTRSACCMHSPLHALPPTACPPGMRSRPPPPALPARRSGR